VNLFTLIADLSGLTAELRESNLLLRRIADALDRAVPPLPLPSPADPSATDRREESPMQFSVAESPEQYLQRTSAEADLAISLGIAPWSPQFQQAILDMRADLMRAKVTTDEEGNRVESPGLSEAEATAIVRDAFALAKAAANERTGQADT